MRDGLRRIRDPSKEVAVQGDDACVLDEPVDGGCSDDVGRIILTRRSFVAGAFDRPVPAGADSSSHHRQHDKNYEWKLISG